MCSVVWRFLFFWQLLAAGGSSGPPPLRGRSPSGRDAGDGYGQEGEAVCPASGLRVYAAKIFMLLTFNLCFRCVSAKCSMTK